MSSWNASPTVRRASLRGASFGKTDIARIAVSLVSRNVAGLMSNEAPPQTDEAWERADRLAYSSSA